MRWSQKLINALRTILLNLVLLVFLLEIVSVIYIEISRPAKYAKYPTYLRFTLEDVYDTANQVNPISPRIIDTLYAWCTWHPKNTIHRQVSECFDIMMKFNHLGSRGQVPPHESHETILFLGDSFAEGWGMDEDSTLPERVGRILNKPVLNLGCSSVGSTQMSLIYETFADSFRHKDVFVMLYLENDFTDNNVRMHMRMFNNRFRPYRIIKENAESEIVYKGSQAHTECSWEYFHNEKKRNFAKVRKVGLKNFLFDNGKLSLKRVTQLTYSRRVLHLVKAVFQDDNYWEKPREFIFDTQDWRILEYDVLSIIRIAKKAGARVTIMNLPSRNLLRQTNSSHELKKNYLDLEEKLNELATAENSRYLSFFNYINNNNVPLDSLFFPCDPHYSDAGTALLAEFITKNLLPNLGK